MKTDGKTKKFSMVDGCVLAGILIVAALVCAPGVTLAKQEKQLANMVERLQKVRSHILLYRAEHNGLLPGQQAPGGAVTAQDFTASIGSFRPRGFSGLGGVPENPYVFDPVSASTVTCVDDPNARPTGREGTGWWFNAATGDFCACDSQFHTRY